MGVHGRRAAAAALPRRGGRIERYVEVGIGEQVATRRGLALASARWLAARSRPPGRRAGGLAGELVARRSRRRTRRAGGRAASSSAAGSRRSSAAPRASAPARRRCQRGLQVGARLALQSRGDRPRRRHRSSAAVPAPVSSCSALGLGDLGVDCLEALQAGTVAAAASSAPRLPRAGAPSVPARAGRRDREARLGEPQGQVAEHGVNGCHLLPALSAACAASPAI